MADRISRWSGKSSVVTEFEFKAYVYNDDDFKVLHFDNYTEQWLDFIILNRGNEDKKQTHDFDIIEGPVANDDIAARVFDYLAGDVSKKDFLNELKFKIPTHQFT
jgi:hypothetical protein